MSKLLFLFKFFRHVRLFTLVLLIPGLGAPPLLAPPFALEGPEVAPDEFRVTVFADGLNFPLGMAELPDGSILATVTDGGAFFSSSGRVVRLVDADDDGVADPPQILFGGLTGPQTAIRVGGELVFVTGAGKPLTILRLGESPSAVLTMVGVINFNYPGDSNYHSHSALELRETPGVSNSYDLFFQLGSEHNFDTPTRTVTISSSSIAGVSGTLLGGSAYMMTIVDHGTSASMESLVRIGTGLRNAAGFAFHPTRGDLYFQDNGIDGLLNVNEPHSADEINFIARSEIGQAPIPDFGFPDNYTAYRTAEVVGGEGVQPLIAFQPIPDPDTGLRAEGANSIEVAPPGFPAGLHGGVFVGFHGKFNMGGTSNDENPLVYANLETGDYFHFIRGQQDGIGHLDGLLATRDSLFVADLATAGNLNNGLGQGVIYQIKSIAAPTPPDLAVRRVDSLFELDWDRGTLQRADEVTGPWENVTEVFSPLVVEPSGPREFYRAEY
ncbi:MAG: hypothetical protein WD490_04605 [Opitutales bacterium]